MLSWLPRVSYLGLFGVLVFTGTGFPIPEEIPVVLAGIASREGYLADPLNPWLAFLSCVLGSIGGDCVMYSIGYHFGHAVLRDHRLFARFLSEEREERIEQMIQRHGYKVFFIARFLVGLRSPVFLTAGILRVSFRRFLLVDTVAVVSVVGLFFWAAYWFADRIVGWLKWIRGFELGLSLAVVLTVVVVALVWYRRLRERALRKDSLLRVRAARRSPGDPPQGLSERADEHIAPTPGA